MTRSIAQTMNFVLPMHAIALAFLYLFMQPVESLGPQKYHWHRGPWTPIVRTTSPNQFEFIQSNVKDNIFSTR